MLIEISKSGSLHWQVYDSIRNKILQGELAEGARLPSSRVMAQELCVSRNVILAAYDNLLAEGYLESRHGSGTYVAAVPDAFLKPEGQSDARGCGPCPTIPLSQFGARIAKISDETMVLAAARPASIRYDFRYGHPAIDLLPWREWQRIVRRNASRISMEDMGYGPGQGSLVLRAEIAKHVLAYRGITCAAEDILIVNGSQQGIDLTARILVNPGDGVVVEDPGYPGVRQILRGIGAQLLPVSVDKSGMRIGDFASLPASVRLICVTPSYQYPLGSVMSHKRRLALIAYARRHNAVILEDDYDSEFRYDTRPERALFGLDPNGQIIYVGTFSKQLFPALRIGYLILPKTLMPAFLTAKMMADRHAPTFQQALLAEFMRGGHLDKHLRRVRTEIILRRTTMIDALNELFGSDIEICGGRAGTHLLVWFRNIATEGQAQLVLRARALGVAIYPVAPCYSNPPKNAGLVMGFASLSPRAISEGLRRLAAAIGECKP